MAELPPCGLYKTVKPINEVPAGRLVYFHNHGNPGAGIYFPETWTKNRANFAPRGMTLPEGFDTSALEPVPAEGFYRPREAFHCCPKECVKFEPDTFLQLGYNGNAKPLVFVPELTTTGIHIPERGTPIDESKLQFLVPLIVAERKDSKDTNNPALAMPRGILIH